MKSFVLHAPFARRIPDPVETGRGERHVLTCKACELPADLPLDPNPRRTQKLDRMVYKDVAQTLRNEIGEPDTFHLKNKGITIIARQIKKEEDDRWSIILDDGQGILDGGHTYRIIRDAIEAAQCPTTQYVVVQILTGYDSRLTEEVAEGLNSSVQVQEKSLADQRGQFDWMKDALNGTDHVGAVAFRENEKAAYDIREIVSFMTLFNIAIHNTDEHPIAAFMSKEVTLNRYIVDEGDDGHKGKKTFRKLRPILKDILELAELVSCRLPAIHNRNGGKAGALELVDYNHNTPHRFPFLGEEGEHKLRGGALYPTLAAFRYLVEEDPLTSLYRWRPRNGFEGVVAVMEAAGAELMRNLRETSADVNYSLSQLGKHKTLWTSQLNTVKAKYLEMQENLIG